MNNQKDIIIKDNEYIKDIALKYSLSDKSNLIYLYKKTQRISAATYLITNYFEDSEPLKMSLRRKTTDLLDSVMSFNRFDAFESKKILLKLNSDFADILSLYEISFLSGILSQNNYQIIVSEIKKVILEIDGINKVSGSVLSIEKSFFDVDIPKTNFSRNENFQNSESKTNLRKEIVKEISEKKESKNENDYIGHVKPEMSFKGTKNDFMSFIKNGTPALLKKETSQNLINSHKGHSNEKKDDRRTMIIEQIKIKGEVTIKDLTDKIQGVSEKTIQRELLRLVDENVLEKQGERRWSKYTLKTSQK